MTVYLTLDFELFLGENSGTVEKCLKQTCSGLSEIALRHGARFTIFVDTTYIQRLKELAPQHIALQHDLDQVLSILSEFNSQGHSLQLHIHPQWAYSDYVGDKWLLDETHYKLSDIPEEKADMLFKQGCEILESITGKHPVAFRAGGFSSQPVSMLTRLFEKYKIRYDSSVYPGNAYHSPQQDYDYVGAPVGKLYHFDTDINCENPNGKFIELPISVLRISPVFYWKLVYQRLTKQKRHQRLGDGKSVATTKSSIAQRLFKPTYGFCTIDESKISYLLQGYREAKRRGDSEFCVIGHPKLATEYSLSALDDCLAHIKADGSQFKTIE